MSFPPSLIERAGALIEACRAADLMIVTAESCTGGLLAALLTEVPGSSDVLERGFVPYSNEAKTETIGVPAVLIEKLGAVSEEVARAMALGALNRSQAQIAVSITGIAGPGGGSPSKPVGLVHLATARREAGVKHRRCQFQGNRETVRLATLETALEMLRERLDG